MNLAAQLFPKTCVVDLTSHEVGRDHEDEIEGKERYTMNYPEKRRDYTL